MSSNSLLYAGNRDQEEEEKRGGRCLQRLIDVEEARCQLLFSVPMIITSLSYYALVLVPAMFVGHIGVLQLAGATLGNSWATVTGIALMVCIYSSLSLILISHIHIWFLTIYVRAYC